MKWEDLEKELRAIPGFEAGFDGLYPYEDVALEIAGLRGRHDMTQTEFGRIVGIPQSSVARLESGQQNPSVGTLKRIAAATGTDLVIEFRQPKGKRRAGKQSSAASSTGDTRLGEPIAASPADD